MADLNTYKIEIDRSRDYGVFENLTEAQTFQQFLEAKKAAVKEDADEGDDKATDKDGDDADKVDENDGGEGGEE
jgi:hypothetical protein|nr:MAG TPA: hypothetical protein [Caudoviricetes sp.]